MKVFDLHCDTLSELRYAEEAGQPKSFAENDLQIDLKKLQKGDYMLQCFAAFVNLARPGQDPLVAALEEIDIFKRIMAKYSELLLEIILQSKEHPTAEQIFMEAKKRNPKIVQATVYNNLKNLLAQGRVIRISNPGQPDRYDNTTRHDHMICTQCGELFDICLADLTSDIERQLGYEIASYQLMVRAICPACRRLKNKDTNQE
mgnify:FL=1